MIQNIRTTLLNAASWANYDAAAVALALEGPFNDDYNQLNQCYQCHGAPDNKVYVNTRWPAVCFDVDNEAMYVKSDLRINNDVWTPASSPVPPIDPVFDNLTHYWSMDEAGGTRADSKGSLNLTESGGAVASAAGIAGNAADFRSDPTKALVNAAFSSLSRPISFSFWFKLTSTTAGDIVFKNDAIGEVLAATVDAGSGLITCGSSFDQGTSGGPPSTGAWHNWVVTIDNSDPPNGVFHFYVDGTEVDGGAEMGPVQADGEFRVGKGVLGPFSYGAAIDGLIDEVAFWNVELTAGNAATIWNGGAGTFYRP